MSILLILPLLLVCSASPASKFLSELGGVGRHDHPHDLPQMSKHQKDHLIKELEDAQILKELEVLIKNLDDSQLENLERILVEDIDHNTEFEKIMKELKKMGLDDEDIDDLKQLAALMNEFLIKVPGVEEKLEMKGNTDLMDNIQLYLLGLPNKLGPLGYIALHHVLEGDEPEHGDIVDVVIEPSSVDTIEKMAQEKHSQELLDDLYTPSLRRRRSIPKVVQKVTKG